MATLCDICHVRPATVRAEVVSNGRRETLNLCDVDYRRLARQQRSSSPLESLFGGRGSLFDDFFDDDGFFGRSSGRGRAPEEDEAGAPEGAARGGSSGGPARARGGAARSGGGAENLSEHAMEILQQAARRTAESGRREVDTEHLLLALTESDVVRTILEQFKVSLDDLRRQVEQETTRESGRKRRRDGEDDEAAEVGVSPRVKDALARAFAASRDFGHSYVGPEHLLIGLAEEGEGVAADVLRRYGLTPQAIRQQVTKVVGRGAEEGRVDTPTNTPNLDKYSRDLTKLAREGKLDPVIGRAKEIETTIEVLARRKKNNPVLIGEPGVGKTAIVEGLAQRIVAGECRSRSATSASSSCRSTPWWRARSTAASSRNGSSRSSRRSRPSRTAWCCSSTRSTPSSAPARAAAKAGSTSPTRSSRRSPAASSTSSARRR